METNNKNYRNSLQDRRLEVVEKHIFVINHELGGIKATQKIIITLIVMILAGLVGLFLK